MNENSGDKSARGFASMDEDKQREIASQGGKAAHQKGTAHEFTSEEAREAGRKGGQARSSGSDQGSTQEQDYSGSENEGD
jgi:general stress protein YciG